MIKKFHDFNLFILFLKNYGINSLLILYSLHTCLYMHPLNYIIAIYVKNVYKIVFIITITIIIIYYYSILSL